MRRKRHSLTQRSLPQSDAGQPVAIFAGALSSQSANRTDSSAEGSTQQAGFGNRTVPAILAWPSVFCLATPISGEATNSVVATLGKQPWPELAMPAGAIADVATWLSGFESVVRLAVPARLTVFVTVGTGIWPIAVDRHRLSAIVFELAMNARDAMAGVGTVAISARNMAAHEPRVDGIPPGDNVVISVRSNRAGMSGDMLVRVAETFFDNMDIDECVGGAITMAGAFLEASGGAIVVRSVLEKITAVDVIVPRADTEPDPPRQALDRKVGQARNVKILVVDDDEAAREVAVDCLKSLGYFVVSAATAESAYNTVQTSNNIDLVISDVVMPDIDGVTLAGMLRSCKPDLPVAFMTGYPRDFMLLGELVLAKPFSLRDLEVLVARGLDRGGERP
jgi:CheY-like chemotaxis protein